MSYRLCRTSNYLLLALTIGFLGVCACTPATTRSYNTGASNSTASGFNDGDESWRHTNEDTEKTRTAEGDATRNTTTKKIFGGAAAAGGRKLGTAVWGPIGGAAGAYVAETLMGQILNGPPPYKPLDRMPTGAVGEEVHGLIFWLEFQWDWAWMEDERQEGSDDQKGKRDLTILVRGYDYHVSKKVTQDSNSVSGWCEIPAFLWPEGKPIGIAIYDQDVLFDDGMVQFEMDDVYGYYKLTIRDGDKSYTVGKLGFLSKSDVVVMRRDYPDKERK